MRAVVAGLVLLLGAAPAAAAEITAYDVTVRSQLTGPARVEARIEIAAPSPGDVLVPVGFATADALQAQEVPAGVTLTLERPDGASLLRIGVPAGTPSPLAVTFTFSISPALPVPVVAAGERATLPGGSRVARHAFVNTQPLRIARYTCLFVMPGGMRVHAIREALPRLGKTEVGPRVRLVDVEGLAGARLAAGPLRQGDSTSMQVEAVPRARPWGLLAAGVLLSVAYLVYFRDLVAPPRA